MVRGEIPTPFNPPENESIRKVFQRQQVPDLVHRMLTKKSEAIEALSAMNQTESVKSLLEEMERHHEQISAEFGIVRVNINVFQGEIEFDEITEETASGLVDWRMSTASYIEDDTIVDYADELFNCLVHEERRDAKQRVKKLS